MSFSPDTAVATPTGTKPIAQVKVGDRVIAYDPSTGAASPQTVTATSIHHDDNLVDVTLQVTTPATLQTTNAAGQATTSLSTKTATTVTSPAHATGSHAEVVHTTTNHPWLTADHGWLPASFLAVGEPVLEANGATATVVTIHAVPGAAAMWDLSLGDVHTFAVGSGQYVVHNCPPGGGSDRGSLRENVNAQPSEQAHHIIPYAERNHALVKLSDYDINGPHNGIRMPDNEWDAVESGGAFHRGSHGSYSEAVHADLDATYGRLQNSGMLDRASAMQAIEGVRARAYQRIQNIRMGGRLS